MPLEVRTLEEADLETFVTIAHEALGSSPIGRAMHGDPPHPLYLQRRLAVARANLSKPFVHLLKVVDTDNDDEIIACATWYFFENGRSEDELRELEKPFQPIEEEGEQAGRVQKEFYKYFNRFKREIGQNPHYYFGPLVTQPRHYRRGAGSLLIRWGTERADKAGIACFLGGSEIAQPLYKRFGFETLEMKEFDLEDYGFEGVERSSTMMRQPVKS